MENKIKRSLYFILSLTLFVSYLLMIAVVYRYSLGMVKQNLKEETRYIQAYVEATDEEEFVRVDKVQAETRITRIDAEGNVFYDSGQENGKLENHANRKEVREALEDGEGSDIRQSNTISKSMIYYAVKLDDGTILRVSKSMDTAFYMALGILPMILVLGSIMALFAWIFTKYQVRKLIKPINELDLEEPLNNNVYEELYPLLERIDKQNKEKEKNVEMRREFTANVSHELKTPLTSISGYAEIMKNGMVRPEDMQGFSERIYKEASRMIRLIGDIIRLSKLDEGIVETEKEQVELHAIAKEVKNRLSILAEQRNILVELSGEPVTVYGVRAVLEEMIYNLCSNAIKYNKENGIVSIWIGETEKGKKIIVRDTGIGISKEDQERVFERFYRADKSHSREIGGTGLGLSIVKHGAILHNAEVTINSEKGIGTTMEILFPIEK